MSQWVEIGHKSCIAKGELIRALIDGHAPVFPRARYGALNSLALRYSGQRGHRRRRDGSSRRVAHEFPRSVVQRVILGVRASVKLENGIAEVLAELYPSAFLPRVKADRSSARLIEELL